MQFITCQSETWTLDTQSPDLALLAEVDLSSYGLSECPVVTASLHGDNRASYSLGTCVETNQGFRVSLTVPEVDKAQDESGASRQLTPALAQELGLSVYWIVIGS